MKKIALQKNFVIVEEELADMDIDDIGNLEDLHWWRMSKS